MIIYKENPDDLTADMLEGFFVGWPKAPSPEKHLEILNSSHKFIIAVDDQNGRVIGFINAVSDGILAAYIPLLEVLPEYQKQGIGSELVRRLLKSYDDLYMIDLVCDNHLVEFYKRHGMIRHNGMMKRNFDKQDGK